MHDSYGPHKTRADFSWTTGSCPTSPRPAWRISRISRASGLEEAEEAAAEEARDNDASNALKLPLEEAAHGAPHRSALRSHLAAVSALEDTVLRVTPEIRRRGIKARRRRHSEGTFAAG